jgi:hypothetical protein
MRPVLAVALLLLCSGCADWSDPGDPQAVEYAPRGQAADPVSTPPSMQESRSTGAGLSSPVCGINAPHPC